MCRIAPALRDVGGRTCYAHELRKDVMVESRPPRTHLTMWTAITLWLAATPAGRVPLAGYLSPAPGVPIPPVSSCSLGVRSQRHQGTAALLRARQAFPAMTVTRSDATS
jgi:hypothetical protein